MSMNMQNQPDQHPNRFVFWGIILVLIAVIALAFGAYSYRRQNVGPGTDNSEMGGGNYNAPSQSVSPTTNGTSGNTTGTAPATSQPASPETPAPTGTPETSGPADR